MSLRLDSKNGQSAWCQYCAWATMLTGALFLTGCGRDNGVEYREYSADVDSKAEEEGLKKADHDHGHGHGPHEGHLIELGEHEYHAEVVFDTATRTTTVYILGADAKTPLPIDNDAVEFELEEGEDEIVLAITAAPLDGEPEGKSSRFEVAGDALPEQIKSEEDFDGHLHITIEGKEYKGELHHDGGHGHSHDDDHEHEEK